MTHSTTTINRNFKIKAFGYDNGKKINTLVGVSGLINLIGEKFADQFTRKAMVSKEQKTTFKLRRGIQVTFYAF